MLDKQLTFNIHEICCKSVGERNTNKIGKENTGSSQKLK